MSEDIQELPPLAVNLWMVTALMAGKSWEPSSSYEPTCSRGGRQVPMTLIESVEKEGGHIGRNTNN